MSTIIDHRRQETREDRAPQRLEPAFNYWESGALPTELQNSQSTDYKITGCYRVDVGLPRATDGQRQLTCPEVTEVSLWCDSLSLAGMAGGPNQPKLK